MIPDRLLLDQLTARARDMLPALRERAPRADKERKIAVETIHDFQAAGFFKLFLPKRYGGFELDYGPAQLALGGEIGRACGSSAWVLTVLAGHSWILGMFPIEAQDDVWKPKPDALLSSGGLPDRGCVERTRGGIEISGRWRFSSGIDHADWALIGHSIVHHTAAPDLIWCLIPRSDFKIENTWFVDGLRGTGSNDLVVEKAFIPEHRIVGFNALSDGTGPGSSTNLNHIYRLPVLPLLSFNTCAPALGIALGALEGCTNERREKFRLSSLDQTRPELDSRLLRIAEAGVRIDSSAALLLNDAQDLNKKMRQAGRLSQIHIGRLQRDLSYASRQFVAAVDEVTYLAGANALFDGHPIRRAFRDIHAVNAHAGLRWEQCAENYVRAVLKTETDL